MCLLLLDFGADINPRDKYGDTPLRSAILGKKTDTAEFLRGKGGVEKAEAVRPASSLAVRPALTSSLPRTYAPTPFPFTNR